MRRTSGHNGLMRNGKRNAMRKGGESKGSMMSDGGMDTGGGRTNRNERRRKRKRKSV
jgi:hypothetical protein